MGAMGCQVCGEQRIETSRLIRYGGVVAVAAGDNEPVNLRQRRRFNELWAGCRSTALSPDRIRFGVWRPYLVPPVVEVGAGDGLLARTFTALQIVSVDQAVAGLRNAPMPKSLGIAERLPLRDRYARTIVMAEVLEHTSDPVEALTECRRIAAPNARLLLSVPTFPLAIPESVYHWARIRQRPTLSNLKLWDPEHERRYSVEELLAQLNQSGWHVLEVVPLFGTATTCLLYFGEVFVERLLRRRIPLAHFGAPLDYLWRKFDRHSGVAVICGPCPASPCLGLSRRYGQVGVSR